MTITLNLPLDAVNLVLEGLSQLPLHRSMALFTHIRDQAEVQIKPVEQKKEE